MVIFIYGQDVYRSRRKLSEIVANFRAREDKANMNTAVVEASKSDIGEIQQALFAPAFLGNKRLVVVNGLLAQKPASQEPFMALLDRLPESTTAIFYETEETKKLEKSPLFERLAKGKFQWEFAPMNAGQMAGWLASEATGAGVAIGSTALASLAENVGSDTARASNELGKLIAYVGAKKQIEGADVALLTAGEVQEDMFGFLDAVAGKQSKKAATMLERQIEAGIEPMQMLSMLARTVRLLIQARDMLERGLPQNEAVRELGIHPFAARKALTQASGFDLATLRALHRALLEADRKIKIGAVASPRLALDLVIAQAVV